MNDCGGFCGDGVPATCKLPCESARDAQQHRPAAGMRVLGVDVEHGVGFSAVDLRTTIGSYRLWLELTDGHVVESVRALTDDYAAKVRHVLGLPVATS